MSPKTKPSVPLETSRPSVAPDGEFLDEVEVDRLAQEAAHVDAQHGCSDPRIADAKSRCESELERWKGAADRAVDNENYEEFERITNVTHYDGSLLRSLESPAPGKFLASAMAQDSPENTQDSAPPESTPVSGRTSQRIPAEKEKKRRSRRDKKYKAESGATDDAKYFSDTSAPTSNFEPDVFCSTAALAAVPETRQTSMPAEWDAVGSSPPWGPTPSFDFSKPGVLPSVPAQASSYSGVSPRVTPLPATAPNRASTLPGAPDRGLSITFFSERFLEWTVSCKGADCTIHDIAPMLVELTKDVCCPRDGRVGCAYVDILPFEDAGKSVQMLSYTWGYKVAVIASALSNYGRRYGLAGNGLFVWMCFACINQHRVLEAQKKGDKVPFNEFRAAFGERVSRIRTIISLITPWETPVSFSRAWCVFELFTAIDEKKEFVLIMPDYDELSFRARLESGQALESVFNTIAQIRIQDAKATVKCDYDNIMRLIEPRFDSANYDLNTSDRVASVNEEVRSRLARSLVHSAQSQCENAVVECRPLPLSAFVGVARALIDFNSEYADAIGLINLGLSHATDKDSDTEARGTAIWQLGRAHALPGDVNKGFDYYMEALSLLRAAGADSGFNYGNLLQSIGALHGEMDRPEQEWQFYDDAKHAYEADDAVNSAKFASLLWNIGTVNMARGDYLAAMQHYLEADQVFKALNPQRHSKLKPILESMIQGAGSNVKLSRRCGLLKLVPQCLTKLRKRPDFQGLPKPNFEAPGAAAGPPLGIFLRSVGVAHHRYGSIDSALIMYRKALAAFMEVSHRKGPSYGLLLRNLGLAYLRQGDESSAAKAFSEALKAYEAVFATRQRNYTETVMLVKEFIHEQTLITGDTSPKLLCASSATSDAEDAETE